MFNQLQRWIKPPVFSGDSDKTSRARLIHDMGLIFVAALIISGIFYVPIFAQNKAASWGITSALMVVYLAARSLLFRGKLDWAAGLMIGFGWTMCLAVAFVGGGMESPMITSVAAITIAVGLIFPSKIGNRFLVLSILAGLGFAVYEQFLGSSPQYFSYSPLSAWFYFAIALVFINRTISLTVDNIRSALTLARQEVVARELSETTYQEIIDSFNEAVYIQNEAGVFLDVNKGAERMYGYLREELIGKTPFAVTAEGRNDLEKVMEQVQEAYNGQPQTFEFWGKRKNGEIFPKEVHLYPGTYFGRKVIVAVAQDITQRKQAEARLVEQNQRYKLLLETSTDAIHILDQGGNLREWNKAFLTHLGYTEEEARSLQVTDWEAQWNQSELLAMISKMIHTSSTFETRHRRKDGTIRDVEISATGLRVNDEDLLFASARDITERKKAEEKLEASEKRFRAVIENLSEAITLLDARGTIVYESPSSVKITGYEVQEQIGRNGFEVIHPDELQDIQAAFSALAHRPGETISMEMRTLHKSGEYRQLICTATNLLNEPAIQAIVVNFHDVTERKRAEQSLFESERRFRETIENIRMVAVELDAEGRLVFCNEFLLQLTGWQRDEIIGQDWFNIFLPADIRTPIKEFFTSSILAGDIPLHNDNEIVTRDGSVRVIAWNNTILRDLSGTIIGTISLGEDITERKQAVEGIKKSLREKEILLRELYHRTKNNMGVIIAILGLQSTYFEDERLANAFKVAQDRIRSMALAHQKLYESQDLSQINLKDYIKELIALLQNSLEITPGQVSFVTEMEDVPVMIDTAVPCGLILNELIANALKYAFPNGQKGEIQIRLRKLENCAIQVSVSDNGIGLPDGFDVRRDGHMGLQTIFALVENQLQGSIAIKAENGVSCQFNFTDNLYEPRI